MNLHQVQEPSCAEIFLQWSPRVQFRYPCYVFVDIESTSHLWGGEFKLLKAAVEGARVFSPTATGAIADHPYTAQVLSHYRPFEISKPGQDGEVLQGLSVAVISELEGLQPWAKAHYLQNIIQFFQSIGLHTLEEVKSFKSSSFRERWAETGVLLHKRLHQQDQQVLSPLLGRDLLQGYGHFDDAVSTISHLQEKLEPQLSYLFLRLQGQGRFAQKLNLILHCEYTEKQHLLQVEPVGPSRDLKLFRDLLLKKLEEIDLDNPIREFELEVIDTPEKVEQLDFFEPRDRSVDRWKRLISFAKQADCEMGFLQVKAAHLPEDSFELTTDWPETVEAKDFIEYVDGGSKGMGQAGRSCKAVPQQAKSQLEMAVRPGEKSQSDKPVQVKFVYGKELLNSPRPSLLLKNPAPLSRELLQNLRKMTPFPTERIETAWWNILSPEAGMQMVQRDYYFALSAEGQWLWIFQDREKKDYFLHGYFD